MSENEEHAAEPGDVQTVAIAPGAGEQPTVPDVAGDLAATMKVETVTQPVATVKIETPTEAMEPAATLALADEATPGTLLLTTPDASPRADAPQEYRRVGAGVPAAKEGASASMIEPATAAAWHGIPPEKPRRRPHRGWFLPLAVLVGVIILLLLQRIGGPLSVSGVAASAGTPSIGCDSTETLTATLRTNGDAGTIIYRWVRSDGTASDELRQTVSSGTKQVDVVLRWAFSGHGTMHALATIEVLTPGTASAVASFDYTCP